ncbi:acyl-CoA/acyl-ACP dehydrogenase [Streptomyces sp. NBC_01239]|uniref:acyl-CoA dehydrogenase family protein n=1 Tax=Streptomyces sp. NBC_01239 TaxID=2903792 RepID=UPI0022502C69|nr:acyl-CoA dehydrogenase family protein [Streptomyces sp. NBC_01239]MCX4815195.1 acyl-CoA/acyl-ACP dehydrogenase [Streptomyces sp. NBC_01239]
MVDFELSEEQAALREVSRDLLDSDRPPRTAGSADDAAADAGEKLWNRGTLMGWTGLATPESHGGAGQGLVELCLVAEELGRAAAPGPFLETAVASMAAARASDPAPGTVRDATGLGEGRLRAGFVHHDSLTVRREPRGPVLSGRATAVHAAGRTDRLLVVLTGDTPCVLLVPTSAARTERRTTLDLTRSWYDVSFDDVPVAAGQVLSTRADEALRWVDAMAVLTAADALGVGERLLEMTVAHVTVREQFGRPLGSFQAVKHKAADMLIALRGVRAATYYAAMAFDADHADATMAAAVAKAFASEKLPDIAGEALQSHGGIGFTWEHVLHLYLRRATVDALVHGTAAHHHERVLTHLEKARLTPRAS